FAARIQNEEAPSGFTGAIEASLIKPDTKCRRGIYLTGIRASVAVTHFAQLVDGHQREQPNVASRHFRPECRELSAPLLSRSVPLTLINLPSPQPRKSRILFLPPERRNLCGMPGVPALAESRIYFSSRPP